MIGWLEFFRKVVKLVRDWVLFVVFVVFRLGLFLKMVFFVELEMIIYVFCVYVYIERE